ncbi:Guanylate kinase family protein [Trichomonas vaginalis G3]|uniref:guanylate kinase n=1 Tax=Trichomonas vaginalis (strain ATCC PRA-98 / G3) TaxID=412133 RepID=A2FSS5_TRIV3|nr:guanylate kinase protein [Trichomonas vaginalis G3]EAX92047.1 Guanylate kinase family protein [Trichomonas vaginalis G3]KAI5485626.1 guanylate kinase protein [Trichomonas vaginalis G3]|eukprot:XP_001304977.1 Guanylate kinase family protein [Trichomonas vaginalis G3]
MPHPIVFVGPSGIGKGTIIGKLRELYPGRFDFSVSHTTRQPREGETDGVQYHFVTREKFQEMVKNGEFLEHADIHGNCYGTSFAAIHQVEATGKICILDVNIDGAMAVYKSEMTPFIILLKPTSFEALEARLRGRGTETEEQIQRRLQTTRRELQLYEENKDMFDLAIINDKLEDTLNKIIEELLKRYTL